MKRLTGLLFFSLFIFSSSLLAKEFFPCSTLNCGIINPIQTQPKKTQTQPTPPPVQTVDDFSSQPSSIEQPIIQTQPKKTQTQPTPPPVQTVDDFSSQPSSIDRSVPQNNNPVLDLFSAVKSLFSSTETVTAKQRSAAVTTSVEVAKLEKENTGLLSDSLRAQLSKLNEHKMQKTSNTDNAKQNNPQAVLAKPVDLEFIEIEPIDVDIEVDEDDPQAVEQQLNEPRDLLLPPNLIRPQFKDDFKIPQQTSAQVEPLFPNIEGDVAKSSNAAINTSINPGWFLKNASEVKLKRDGQVFYLDVNRSLDQVWQLVLNFLAQKNIEIQQSNIDTAYIETAWQSYKPRIPAQQTGFLNSILGSLTEGAHGGVSTPILNRFRVHFLVASDEKTEIFVHHEGLVERVLDGDTHWEPVKNNHAQEVMFLYDLIRFLGLNEKQVAQAIDVKDDSLLKWASNKKDTILYYRNYPSAWRQVNTMLTNSAELVLDSYDRSIGEIYVKSPSALESDQVYIIVLRENARSTTSILIKQAPQKQASSTPVGETRGVRVISDILFNLLKRHDKPLP